MKREDLEMFMQIVSTLTSSEWRRLVYYVDRKISENHVPTPFPTKEQLLDMQHKNYSHIADMIEE